MWLDVEGVTWESALAGAHVETFGFETWRCLGHVLLHATNAKGVPQSRSLVIDVATNVHVIGSHARHASHASPPSPSSTSSLDRLSVERAATWRTSRDGP